MLIALLCILLLLDFLLFTIWDKYIVSFVGLILIGVGAYYFMPTVATFIDTHTWQDFAIYSLYYLGAGVIVAGLKWLMLNLRIGRKLREIRVDFEKSYEDTKTVLKPANERSINVADDSYKQETKTPADKRREFMKQVNASSVSIYKENWRIDYDNCTTEEQMVDELLPHAIKYVDRITFWVLQWPFALLSLVFEDILLKIGRWVSEVFEALFTRMSRYMIKRAVKGL